MPAQEGQGIQIGLIAGFVVHPFNVADHQRHVLRQGGALLFGQRVVPPAGALCASGETRQLLLGPRHRHGVPVDIGVLFRQLADLRGTQIRQVLPQGTNVSTGGVLCNGALKEFNSLIDQLLLEPVIGDAWLFRCSRRLRASVFAGVAIGSGLLQREVLRAFAVSALPSAERLGDVTDDPVDCAGESRTPGRCAEEKRTEDDGDDHRQAGVFDRALSGLARRQGAPVPGLPTPGVPAPDRTTPGVPTPHVPFHTQHVRPDRRRRQGHRHLSLGPELRPVGPASRPNPQWTARPESPCLEGWALQSDDDVDVVIRGELIAILSTAGGAAVNEDVALFAGVIHPYRLHWRTAFGSPVPRHDVHMSGPQAAGAMIAVAAAGVLGDGLATVNAVETGVLCSATLW